MWRAMEQFLLNRSTDECEASMDVGGRSVVQSSDVHARGYFSDKVKVEGTHRTGE
jgi:hypothetical protein